MKRVRIFAFGGNEVAPVGLTDEHGNPMVPDISMQWQKTDRTAKRIAEIIKEYPDDYYIITHGNGPQVGNILLRAEYSRKYLPPLPLDVCGADSQGAMGYMISQILSNELRTFNIYKNVVSIVTQTVVDKDDPAFKNPTKFIGPPYSKDEALERKKNEGWEVKFYKKNKLGQELWRKVVPSPKPVDIVEIELIEHLLYTGAIPIAVGGGGIPVIHVDRDNNGVYKCNYNISFKSNNEIPIYSGVEAVVDKDLASALLGRLLLNRARERSEDIHISLTIFTNEDGAKLYYQTPQEKSLRKITAAEAKKYYEEGHFPAGSMGPKIMAAAEFVENGGDVAYITKTDLYLDTLNGKAGTTIVK